MELPYYRDTWVEVNLDCIYENVTNMKKHLPSETDIIAVVKANGYGHGAVQVAETALAAGANWLAVALLDEALELRANGILAPILVLGWTRPQDVQIAQQQNITLTVFQREWLEVAGSYLNANSYVNFHLKLDTGMGRIGVREKAELDAFLKYIKEHPQFVMTGVFTHFATADELDLSYFHEQYNRFVKFLEWVKEHKRNQLLIHCANSATGLRFPEKTFNAVRFGIAMYGLTPSPDIKNQLPFQLKEAFSLKSKLVHIKRLGVGEKISYGSTYETKKNEWIGTIPIGYADGWIRKLKYANVLVDGEFCPIVGRICMDQMMVRLPKELPVGTDVTLIGEQGKHTISVDDVAKQLDTINYEIPCIITSRVPRVYVRNNN
ncbi:alanine racemase [Bacillus sp. Marseille-P3661]|uniref:alanine racemase n=1 Tax=Bacillus sp. Marseille-P3661 TaxID=1936234 RepID=UPI0021558FC1|nr:alanine racemase [Bacillus sp. Marseille-P3661]